LKAKARNDRRRHREKQVDLMSQFPSPPQEGRDWETLLDEEINRLPEKYRLPIILCDLEGRSRKEVERELQVPAGTLSSRLAMAKRILADRLTRRGVVLAGGALWAAPQATAAVPAALVAATAHKAVLVAAGEFGAISGSVSVLMKAGVKAMKLKATVATLMVIASLGAVGLVYSGGDEIATGSAKPQSEVDKLRKEIDLLRVNLRVTLEKIQVLENELRAVKGPTLSNLRQPGTGAGLSTLPVQPGATREQPKPREPGTGPGTKPALPGTTSDQLRFGASRDPIMSGQPAANQKTRLPQNPSLGNKSETPLLPRDDSGTSPSRQGGAGQKSQIPADKAGAASGNTTGAHRLLGEAGKDVGRPSLTNVTGPTVADKDNRFREANIGNVNTNKVLEDLGRALNNLADPNAGHKDESLRRAVQTLEQLLNELRSLDGNRLEEPRKR
jgi:hypothetical protein